MLGTNLPGTDSSWPVRPLARRKPEDAALARRKARGVTFHAQGLAFRARLEATHLRADPGEPGSLRLVGAPSPSTSGEAKRQRRRAPLAQRPNRGRSPLPFCISTDATGLFDKRIGSHQRSNILRSSPRKRGPSLNSCDVWPLGPRLRGGERRRDRADKASRSVLTKRNQQDSRFQWKPPHPHM